MSSAGPQDELTAAVFSVVEALPPTRKAKFLLEHTLELIEAGKYVTHQLFPYETDAVLYFD